MAELVAVAFDDVQEADRVLTELSRLQKEYLIDLEDAVVVIRPREGKIKLKQSINLVSAGAASGGLWGGLWGSLIGLLFLSPLTGFAVSANSSLLPVFSFSWHCFSSSSASRTLQR